MQLPLPYHPICRRGSCRLLERRSNHALPSMSSIPFDSLHSRHRCIGAHVACSFHSHACCMHSTRRSSHTTSISLHQTQLKIELNIVPFLLATGLASRSSMKQGQPRYPDHGRPTYISIIHDDARPRFIVNVVNSAHHHFMDVVAQRSRTETAPLVIAHVEKVDGSHVC